MSEENNEAEFWRDIAQQAMREAVDQQAEANALLGLIAEILQRLPDYERGIILASMEDRIEAAREKVALDLADKFRRATGRALRPDQI
jgi:hypothetical protein